MDGVVSRREARLVFWLVRIALVGFIFSMSTGFFAVLASPAIILFVAWLLSYLLEPPVSFVQRHLPFKGRAVTDYLRQRDVLLRATGDEPPPAATFEKAATGTDA